MPLWLRAWWQDVARPLPDAPEVSRVKMSGYVFAMLVAIPGLLLLLRELLIHHAWPYAVTHGAVMVGAALLLPWTWRHPERLGMAERIFAALLTLSAVGFLVLYGQHPEAVLGYDLIGSVLLFIVAGLLLILPPQLSLPLSVALLIAYRFEVNMLSGVDREKLLLSQWVNTGMFALLMVGVTMRQTLAGLTERLHLLEELSARDTLTGLLNRRGFEQQAAALRLDGTDGSLIVLDIDHFKPVNDTHGHTEGDRILVGLGQLMKNLVPPDGLAARWGGEEFVLYLHGQDVDAAHAFADDLRAAVQDATLGRVRMTISSGVAAWRTRDTLHHAFLHADDAMYEAKQAGRNRVIRSSPPASGHPAPP
ncbi:GGDEF domain-containing protein [Deinococcus sp. KSM4-11]|uniref:GGDEF domain-containing protein n=1 Tax=Deinococcus sp. KSM4-11 TaxID=2568654 RepID=UPI0010A3EC99|nr:GGDEF domain-containing protein [Deinococcus sp. KSM4-11]THF84764.1 GGDEF domain-containing protein [Deinococcus sp. KSM4-11]